MTRTLRELLAAERHGVLATISARRSGWPFASLTPFALSDRGERVRLYLPFGELIPGLAYLVRRLLENTASQSFVRLSGARGTERERLLNSPCGQTA